MSTPSILIQQVLEFLTTAIRHEEKIKGIKMGNEVVLNSRWHDLTFSKVAGYKINLQKSIAFLYTNNEQTDKENRKTIPFIISSKNKIHWNKHNKGCEQPLQWKL
jgi:hypothetical protein